MIGYIIKNPLISLLFIVIDLFLWLIFAAILLSLPEECSIWPPIDCPEYRIVIVYELIIIISHLLGLFFLFLGSVWLMIATSGEIPLYDPAEDLGGRQQREAEEHDGDAQNEASSERERFEQEIVETGS